MEEFKEKDEENSETGEISDEDSEADKKIRVKLPRKNQLIGIIEQRLGGNKMRVICSDKKLRVCRIPGRLKRKLWLRPGDVVIIETWELDKERADIIFKYNLNQARWLKNHGYLEKENLEF